MLERKFSRAAVVEASFHSICQIIPFPSRIAHGKYGVLRKIRSGVRRRHFRLRIHGEVHPTMPVEVTRSVSSKQWRCAVDGGADLDSGIPEAQVTELAEGGIARAISANLPSEGGG